MKLWIFKKWMQNSKNVHFVKMKEYTCSLGRNATVSKRFRHNISETGENLFFFYLNYGIDGDLDIYYNDNDD